jgi:hypothetical protein
MPSSRTCSISGASIPVRTDFQLPGVAENQLPQQCSDGRRGVDPAEERLHPADTHDVEVVDAFGAGAHPGDKGGQLR